ncbi:unnamed protein product, partial [marine sediment metagenome]
SISLRCRISGFGFRVQNTITSASDGKNEMREICFRLNGFGTAQKPARIRFIIQSA